MALLEAAIMPIFEGVECLGREVIAAVDQLRESIADLLQAQANAAEAGVDVINPAALELLIENFWHLKELSLEQLEAGNTSIAVDLAIAAVKSATRALTAQPIFRVQ